MSARPSDDGHVDHALFDAIYTQKRVRLVVVQRCDLATAQAQRYCPECDVLGDVPGIQVDVAIGQSSPPTDMWARWYCVSR